MNKSKTLTALMLTVALAGCNNSDKTATNRAPTINAGADQSVVAGSEVTLSALVTDDGTPVINWYQISGTPEVALSDKSSATTTFTAPNNGVKDTYVFTVSADDGANPLVEDSVTITVTPSPTELRTMQEELNFVKSKAKSLTKNSKGYWQANFANGLVMIYVPKGTFTMGNNALAPTETYPTSPEHEVSLDHYWISKTPVTRGQFRQFIEATQYVTDVEKATSDENGCFVYDFDHQAFVPKLGYKWDDAYKDIVARHPEIVIDDTHPVSCVSWNDAIAYTEKLKNETGLEFSLPTEAEWEFAARGTDGRVYPWGNETPNGTLANYADDTFYRYFPNLEQALVHHGVDDGYAVTSPVGSFPLGASPIGALDMAGNLTEWVYDTFSDYTAEPKYNPVHSDPNGEIRMQKAGFWAGSAGREGVTPNEINIGHNIRADARQGDTPAIPDDHLGFRIAISYTPRQ